MKNMKNMKVFKGASCAFLAACLVAALTATTLVAQRASIEISAPAYPCAPFETANGLDSRSERLFGEGRLMEALAVSPRVSREMPLRVEHLLLPVNAERYLLFLNLNAMKPGVALEERGRPRGVFQLATLGDAFLLARSGQVQSLLDFAGARARGPNARLAVNYHGRTVDELLRDVRAAAGK